MPLGAAPVLLPSATGNPNVRPLDTGIVVIMLHIAGGIILAVIVLSLWPLIELTFLSVVAAVAILLMFALAVFGLWLAWPTAVKAVMDPEGQRLLLVALVICAALFLAYLTGKYGSLRRSLAFIWTWCSPPLSNRAAIKRAKRLADFDMVAAEIEARRAKAHEDGLATAQKLITNRLTASLAGFHEYIEIADGLRGSVHVTMGHAIIATVRPTDDGQYEVSGTGLLIVCSTARKAAIRVRKRVKKAVTGQIRLRAQGASAGAMNKARMVRYPEVGNFVSICQPWAHLIVNGSKNIENRDWPTSYGRCGSAG
jgi:hypothetical protein